jgi:hypothetical protein
VVVEWKKDRQREQEVNEWKKEKEAERQHKDLVKQQIERDRYVIDAGVVQDRCCL